VYAAIQVEGSQLEAELKDAMWTVRHGEREASSQYLDYALSKLFDDDSARIHQLAARVIAEAETG
jgi:hypothetical protein